MNTYPHFRLLRGTRSRQTWMLELSLDSQRKAWSLPRGAVLHPHERHLAIDATDVAETLSAPTECWDAGPAEIRKWTDRHIVTVLHGAKLRGCFSLVRFRNSGRLHWLWVRVKTRDHRPRRVTGNSIPLLL
jgi:hypothetical protein